MSVKFSVFTPVFNRKNKIHRVYESLINQTYRNFEWIVVDDGSSDNVMDLLYEYKNQVDFPITIIQQQNSGKHIAWNRAVAIAKGELFVPADSDDRFVPETLEVFHNTWNSIDYKQRKKLMGIGVLCKDSKTGEIIGDKFPVSPFISNNLDLHFIYKIKGEKWGCIKTELLKKRPFPEIVGSFFPETWVWYWLARDYNMYCVNIPLRIYYQNEDDNLTNKPSIVERKKRARVMYNYEIWNFNENFDYIIKYQNIFITFKMIISFWRNVFYLRNSIHSTLRKFNSKLLKFLLILGIVPGFILYHISSE